MNSVTRIRQPRNKELDLIHSLEARVRAKLKDKRDQQRKEDKDKGLREKQRMR